MLGYADFELLAVALLLVASVVAIAARYLHVPYTVALIVAGLVISFTGLVEVSLSHDLILLVFLPPLLFDGAINMDLLELRQRWIQVGLLATVGTVLTAATVTAALWLVGGLSVEYALLLGVMLAPTDPVSVLVTMKEHGVAGGLRTLLEGESVFNDAIGIVLFVIALDIAFGDAAGGSPSVGYAVREFASEVAVGATVGLALGLGINYLMRLLDDRFVEITLSVTLSFGAFLIADQLGGSGILAVVAGGLLIGNYGLHRTMAPASRAALIEFWEMVTFLLNSALFLLIGLHFEVQRLFEGPTAAAVGVGLCGLLAGRAIAVYGLLWPFRRSPRFAVPIAWRHAIFWGGLRGSIPVALVLGLTGTERELDGVDAVGVVFALVLLSLIGQGLTFGPLLERLGLGNNARSTIAGVPLSGSAGSGPD